MKKIALTLVLLLTVTTVGAKIYHYDVNKDGVVSITDVTFLVNNILGVPNAGEVENNYVYDVNGDGVTNVTDVTFLVNNILGILNSEEELPSPSYLYCPDDHHPHLIDLGLPSGTLWACCNVDTEHPENQSPTNYGGYYAWGETEEKDYYDWDTYKWCDGSYDNLTKYNIDSGFGMVDNKTVLDPEDDVAHVKWGGDWRMPTREEMEELCKNCTSEWTTLDGVSGRKITGSNGGSIFIPAAGNRSKDNLKLFGSYGLPWSSSLYESSPNGAYDLLLYSVGAYRDYNGRCSGQSVRPVRRFPPFSVSSTEVTIQLDGTADVTISGGYNVYEVESANPDIVTISLNGSTVTLTSVDLGETTVTVKDVLTFRTIDITVKVESQYCPDKHHPHLIDLGLPSGTKWACCNVDGDQSKQSPSNYGGYYAWGETEEKDYYDWDTYKWCNGSGNSLTKYNIDSEYGIVDNKTMLDPEDDVAHVKWGGEWRMPTREEQEELCTNCTSEWTTLNGVSGRKITGSNGKSIFLPASGGRWMDLLILFDSNSGYWSSSLDETIPSRAHELYISSEQVEGLSEYRQNGLPVRPVR